MNQTTQQILLALLPTEWHDRAYVAGGYAVDPDMAGDIDVWILGSEMTSEERAQFWHHYVTQLRTRAIQVNPQGFEAAIVRADLDGDAPDAEDGESALPDNDTFSPLGTYAILGIDKPVQILLTTHDTPQDLLNVFDISTHQMAIGVKHLDVVVVPTTTPPWDAPNLVDINRPLATLTRLIRINRRYGFLTRPEDVSRLLEAARFGR